MRNNPRTRHYVPRSVARVLGATLFHSPACATPTSCAWWDDSGVRSFAVTPEAGKCPITRRKPSPPFFPTDSRWSLPRDGSETPKPS